MATSKSIQPHRAEGALLSAEAGDSSTSQGGYTLAQLRAVLVTIASQTDTLHQLLMRSQANDDVDAAIGLDAAVLIAANIGAMADSATGGNVLGYHDRWHFGPHFANEGKAVQS